MLVATPGKRYGQHWEADRSVKVQGNNYRSGLFAQSPSHYLPTHVE